MGKRRQRIARTAARSDHAELLSKVNLFRGLDRVALAKLAGNLETLPLRAGTPLFYQGDLGDAFYLVSDGALGVYARAMPDLEEMLLNVIHRGEAVGEMALLSEEPRNATVRAEQDSEVLRLPKARFLALVRSDPSVALAISATLIERLRIADAARLGAVDSPAFAAPEAIISSAGDAAGKPPDSLRRMTGRRITGLALSFLILTTGWFLLPPPAGLGVPGWHALVSLLGIVPLLATEAMPEGAIALLLAGVWAGGGVVPTRIALSGFSTSTWILTVSVFTVGAAIASSGLLYRLALWAVTVSSSFRWQAVMLGLSGVVLGPAVPNTAGRMSLITQAVREMADALGYEPGSKSAAGLAMAAFVGYGQMAAPFLTSSSTALLAFALLPDVSRGELSWASWAVRAAPLHVILLIGLLSVVLWHSFGAEKDQVKQRSERTLALQRALLGRPSRREILVGALSFLLLLGFASQSLHGIDPGWIAVSSVVILAGAGAVTIDTLRAINWSTALLLGMLAGIGNVFSATKLDAWLARLVAESTGGLIHIPLAFVLSLALVCLILSFVLRWQAAVPVMIVVLSPVALNAGIDPWIVAIVTLTASNTFFMPYQSASYMALYEGTGERLLRHAQARPLSIAYAVLVLLGLTVSVPYWRALRLL